jgi:hypothetical protein
VSDVEPAPPSFWRAVRLTLEGAARNARTCLVLVSLYAVLNGIASAIGSTFALDFDPLRASGGGLVAISAAAVAGLGTLILVGIFVYPPTIGALSLVGSAAVSGDVLETHGIVRRVLDRVLDVIGAFILTALILLVAPIVAGLIALGVVLVADAETGLAALVFTVIVLGVPALYVLVRLSLAVPVVLREGVGPLAALRRSWDLVGGSWWWVFGVAVVVAVVAGVLSSLVSTVFSLGSTGLTPIAEEETPNRALVALGTAAGAAVTGSLYGVLTGVLYAARAQHEPPPELPLPEQVPPGALAAEE